MRRGPRTAGPNCRREARERAMRHEPGSIGHGPKQRPRGRACSPIRGPHRSRRCRVSLNVILTVPATVVPRAHYRSCGYHENVASSIEHRKEARKALRSSGRSQNAPSGANQDFRFRGTICGTNSINYWFCSFICGRRLHQAPIPYCPKWTRGERNPLNCQQVSRTTPSGLNLAASEKVA